MKCSVVIFLLLLLFSCIREQEIGNEVDLKEVDARLNHYWDMYEGHKANMPDSALFYMQEIKKLAEAAGKAKWLAAAYQTIGDVHRLEHNLGESTYNYLKAAHLYQELGELKRLAVTYTSLGLIYEAVEDYQNAIAYCEQAKEILIYEGNSIEKANVYRNLAIYHTNLKQFKEAEAYVGLAEEVALKIRNSSMLSKVYNTFGSVNFNQGRNGIALGYYQKALEFSENTVEGQWVKAAATNNIFEVYFCDQNYEQAELWLYKALVLKKEMNDFEFLQSTLNLYGEMLMEQGRYREMVDLLRENISRADLAKANAAIGEGLILMQEALTKIATEGKAENAVYLSKNLATLNAYSKEYDSQALQLRKKLGNLTKQLSVQANVEKYSQQEEAEKAAEMNLKIILISVFLLICATAIIMWMMRKNKRYKELFSKVEGILNAQSLRHMKKS